MTDNSTGLMTSKYKVVITADIAQLILESGVKPQNDAKIVFMCACHYEVSI